MKILALETTEPVGTVAAMTADRVLAELPLPPLQRSSQSLIPTLGRLLDRVGWRPSQVRVVAVSIGPGSFTGLRIGVTAAKFFAYTVGAQLVAVPTLQVVANQAPAQAAPVWAVIDAHRGQLFASLFPADQANSFRQPTGEARLVSFDPWRDGLKTGDWVTGPALTKYSARLSPEVLVVDSAVWSPSAATVARIGWQRYQQGQRDDLWQLVPQYVRKSAAQEKWERHKK